MFFSAVLRTSRTSYRGSSGSGRGASAKTFFRSSPASRSTLLPSVLAGHNFKRAQRGLFDGALPQSGNTIPKSRQKTARTWRPNIQNRNIYSDILEKDVKAKVTTRALRTIRKYGGLDTYLAQRNDKVLGEWGRSLRSRIASKIDPIALEKSRLQDERQNKGDEKKAARLIRIAEGIEEKKVRKDAQLLMGSKRHIPNVVVVEDSTSEASQTL